MKIELLGWKSVGLRSPDIDVNFTEKGKLYHITLLQMPNGTGKTTTLNLIRAALTGAADSWKSEQVIMLRRPRADNAQATFICRLEVDDKPLTFEMEFDFTEGQVHYRTTFGSGIKEGWDPPPSARAFLNEQFIDLFIFDGEYAQKLLDPKKNEAEKAIDSLFQLYLFRNMRGVIADELDILIKEKAAKGISAKSKMGLEQKQAREQEIRDRILTVKRNREDTTKKLDKGRHDHEKKSKILSEYLSKNRRFKNALDGAQADFDDKNRTLQAAVEGLSGTIRSPIQLYHGFPCTLFLFSRQLDSLKIPSNTSKQFFMDLLNQTECICGKPMDEAAKESLLAKAQEFLGDDVSGVINYVKGSVPDPSSVDPESLHKTIGSLNMAIKERDKAATKHQAIKSQISEESDEKYRLLAADCDRLARDIEVLEDLIQCIDAEPTSSDEDIPIADVFSLKFLDKKLKQTHQYIDEIKETVRIRAQTDIFCQILEESCNIARQELHDLVVAECNKKLTKILERDPIRIAAVKNSILIELQSGVSVGQSLAVGYTFLSTLLGWGKHAFPLVVDSPAGPLDRAIRSEIGKIIPELCHQFIAFTISTERLGFVDSLDEHCEHIQYLTLFRKTPGTHKLLKSLPKKCTVQTDTGVLVEDKDYFYKFDIEKEI